MEVSSSLIWGKGEYVSEFELKYAELMGAKRCLATASGTTALLIAPHVLGVDAGDEVLVSPYTFVATYNRTFINKALPVFVDTDPETFLIDPSKMEERITDRTVAILPVHMIEEALNSRGYQRLFSKKRLKQWREENRLPGNDQLAEEAVTFYQRMLLGSESDMDDIVNAVAKIYENRESLGG